MTKVYFFPFKEVSTQKIKVDAIKYPPNLLSNVHSFLNEQKLKIIKETKNKERNSHIRRETHSLASLLNGQLQPFGNKYVKLRVNLYFIRKLKRALV